MNFLKKYILLTFHIFIICTTIKASDTILRVGLHTFPNSLNPIYSTTEDSQPVINKIFDSLYYYDKEGKITSDLVARTTATLEKGRSVTRLTLKKGIRFSDGKELDANDIIQTIRILKNPVYNYPYLSTTQCIDSVEKIDLYDLVIRWSSPIVSWQNHLTFKILNSRQISNVSPAILRKMNLTGTGPYVLKSVKAPVRIILEINKFYSEHEQKLNSSMNHSMYRYIHYDVFTDAYLAPLKLINHEIDICELQPESVVSYSRLPEWQKKFRVISYKKSGYTYLVFNLKNPAITPNLRNHIYNTLIAGNFVERFLEQKGEPVKTPFLYHTSHEASKRLNTFPLKPVTLRILTNSESKIRKEFVLFLAEELKPLRITLEPIFLEYNAFLDYLKKGKFDLAVSGYMMDSDQNMNEIFNSDSYFNYSSFRDKKMELLLKRGLTEFAPVKRESIYSEALGIWKRSLPFIPLFSLYYYVGVSRDVPVPSELYSVVSSEGDFLYNISQWKPKFESQTDTGF